MKSGNNEWDRIRKIMNRRKGMSISEAKLILQKEDEVEVECPICQKVLTKNDLKIHANKVHEINVKKAWRPKKGGDFGKLKTHPKIVEGGAPGLGKGKS